MGWQVCKAAALRHRDRWGGKTATFNYYCNSSKLDPSELRQAFYYFLSDGNSYENCADILEFANEFGYSLSTRPERERCRQAYDGCKRSYEDFKAFGINSFDLANYLQERYDL